MRAFTLIFRLHSYATPAPTHRPATPSPTRTEDARWNPQNTDAGSVSGNIARYTVPGTDVFVVDTGER